MQPIELYGSVNYGGSDREAIALLSAATRLKAQLIQLSGKRAKAIVSRQQQKVIDRISDEIDQTYQQWKTTTNKARKVVRQLKQCGDPTIRQQCKWSDYNTIPKTSMREDRM